MTDVKVLTVSEYTTEPYGRYIDDGDGNGEEYRTDYIMPILKKGHNLIINLDGVEDEYGSSFVVEAFANLIRKENMTYDEVKQRITFISNHQDWLDEIEYYLTEAKNDIHKRILMHG